ncbi:MAG TPA: hypothetical protein VMT85_13270 [Thermoanaerobaculia bacterium]|nr:hypothetical protein [Thermoanaerobaculia bacterium]
MLLDALVRPDEAQAATALLKGCHPLEYIEDQIATSRPSLIPGASVQLLERCGIPLILPFGDVDPGLIKMTEGRGPTALGAFIKAVGCHRHPERDRDPPLV